ncbi:MAG: type IV toxin-antitoxin system AbiEi family antitoxin domain-containing protein [Actinomycetota bacterium]|nr:type IV toxin-antitoxin system AbiEi family antitoxin domain-containing protein [Actinomycetota bacterium]
MDTERQINQLAASQGGIIRIEQALASGLTYPQVRYRVDTGTWVRVIRGVLRIFDMAHCRDRLRAAVAALPTATVSHESAAEIHAIPYVRRDLAVVSVHSQTTHAFPAVTVHRNHDLDPAHVVIHDELPVTTVCRTVIDLAAVLTANHIESIVDDLFAAKRLTVNELDDAVDLVSRRGKPGSTSLHELLALRRDEPDPSPTPLERRGFEVLADGELPEPIREYPMPWNESRRFDAAYPQARLAIEWDSRRWHTQVSAFETDRQRDRQAAIHGWRVLRFTWRDVTTRPREVADTVRRALER